MVPGRWKDKGLCARPENTQLLTLFFSPDLLDRYQARELCNSGCPVKDQCLKWALEARQIWGVWGGLDEGELRRALAVDAKGKPLQRCRYPHCPSCKARPSHLYVVSACKIDQRATGNAERYVECSACGFVWRSGSSVNAVLAYWTEKRRLERERIRAKSPARHDAGGTVIHFIPAASSSSPAEPTLDEQIYHETTTALVASASPQMDVG